MTMAPPARDYTAFLREQLATQPHNVMSHVLGNEQIWIKRGGVPHGMGRYRAMAVLAGLLRLPVLRPVPNPGGPAAIATEVRRLHELAACGVRVPVVLAAQENGFAMRHLGRVGEEAHSLGNAIERALRADDPAAVLPLAVCHVRDALCYAHSTAIFLQQSGGLPAARERWAAWVAQGSPEMREVLATSVRRMRWMRRLPASRRLGRDLQRVRAAYDLLA